ncbi:MAG: prolyl oligopeptidase family serine peptidase [Phycisphaerae bacterium]
MLNEVTTRRRPHEPRLVRPMSAVPLTVIGLLATAGTSPARQVYDMPPDSIAALIDAPPTPAVSIGPRKDWMVVMERAALPPISEVSRSELRLAGLRIDPTTNSRSRASYYTRLVFKRLSDGHERPVRGLPEGARIGPVRWSPDGEKIVFTLTRERGVQLWAADSYGNDAHRLTSASLNAIYGFPCTWRADSETLICRRLPGRRGPVPTAPGVPQGPSVQENMGDKAPARTYQDLLKTPNDQELLDYYLETRIGIVTLDSRLGAIGKAGDIIRAVPSPDSKHILIEAIRRPYSYLVPLSRFPRRVEVWDNTGRVEKVIADIPLAENVPIGFGAVRTGPRAFAWRADAPATLYWVEAQDGGDPRRQAAVRDRVYQWKAPFEGNPVELVSLALRFSGVTWGHETLALVSEWWWKNRKTRTLVFNPSAPGSEPTVLFDRSFEDRYNDPGRPLLRDTPTGTSVLLTASGGKAIFLRGRGASPEGDRPFLDRLDLASKKTERLFRSEAPYYESVVDLVDVEKLTVVTRRESKTDPPNYVLRNLKSGDISPITEFSHPTPQLKNVYKEQIRYQRDDGVPLTATLYLPPGKKPADGPFPMLMWAYPQEFKSAAAAGQVTDSPHRFVRVRPLSPLLWLVHGYAVLDDPSLPIIGEGNTEPNDAYVKQLVAGAKAAVDEVVRRGVAQRGRIAIGGHSYGAFMTANLLAHSDLFAAGIARSGAYNRTLTPFGFQAEERTLWQTPEIYFAMSPFMHAEKINEPILLIHGEADNNSGTFPIQSKRFYHALKGHGATARLVMLPHESHGYRARESVMHMAAEMTHWLDRYVKKAKPTGTSG